MKKEIPLILIGLLLLCAGCTEKKLDVVGSWRLDADETVDKAIRLGQLPEEEKKKMLERFKSREERYNLSINEDRITSEKFDETYTSEHKEKDETKVHFEVKGKPVTLTFSRYRKEHVIIKSSETNDMDYLVWRREPSFSE
ncbi:MAG: hypothetical protein ABGY95_04280 [Rubritalea sp.]|uniref:hypothetical protein n=1 Tax=Rubritalea sp. TaxID=2109375 RepID=UPI00324292DF